MGIVRKILTSIINRLAQDQVSQINSHIYKAQAMGMNTVRIREMKTLRKKAFRNYILKYYHTNDYACVISGLTLIISWTNTPPQKHKLPNF